MNVNTIASTYSQPILEAKIEKKKHHIDHLKGALGHRKTHGGKRYRARQISLKEQIKLASQELELLNQAKRIIKVKPEELKVSMPINEELDLSQKISDELLDPVSLELMEEACFLYPCGHTFNKSTIDEIDKLGKELLCPSCRTPIEGGGYDLLTRNIVKHYQTMQNPNEVKESLQKIKADLLDPMSHQPMTEAMILSPCGHTIDQTSLDAITRIGQDRTNLCSRCHKDIDYFAPHYTVKNLSTHCNSKGDPIETIPLRKIMDTLTPEDFDLIGDYVGNIFASSINMSAPKITLNCFGFNRDENRQESYHNYAPTVYHRFISRILSVNLQKEFKSENVSRKYTHGHFLIKLETLKIFDLLNKIFSHAAMIDLNIQISLDPKRNTFAKNKEDLIFTLSFEKNGMKNTKSFAIKDLHPHFPRDAQWK